MTSKKKKKKKSQISSISKIHVSYSNDPIRRGDETFVNFANFTRTRRRRSTNRTRSWTDSEGRRSKTFLPATIPRIGPSHFAIAHGPSPLIRRFLVGRAYEGAMPRRNAEQFRLGGRERRAPCYSPWNRSSSSVRRPDPRPIGSNLRVRSLVHPQTSPPPPPLPSLPSYAGAREGMREWFASTRVYLPSHLLNCSVLRGRVCRISDRYCDKKTGENIIGRRAEASSSSRERARYLLFFPPAPAPAPSLAPFHSLRRAEISRGRYQYRDTCA